MSDEVTFHFDGTDPPMMTLGGSRPVPVEPGWIVQYLGRGVSFWDAATWSMTVDEDSVTFTGKGRFTYPRSMIEVTSIIDDGDGAMHSEQMA